MMAHVLSRPMLAFVTVYLVMAVGTGCIVEFELNQPLADPLIQLPSAAISDSSHEKTMLR